MRDDLVRLPKELFHAKEIRRLEPLLARKLGIELYGVMEEAGRRAFHCLQRHWPAAREVLVICGRGNNGGDGFVLARLAKAAGINVHVRQAEPERAVAGDAAQAKSAFVSAGGVVEDVKSEWPYCDVLVDALLGSGLSGELSPAMRQIIERINVTETSVLALDVPSGINGDTAAAMPIAVKANVTITFVGMKPALLTGAGAVHAGEIELAGLQLGECPELQTSDVNKCALTDFSADLSPRGLGSHKGSHGRVLVIGGDEGMAGAVRIAGEGALRAGAGLVGVLTRPSSLVQGPDGTTRVNGSWNFGSGNRECITRTD